MRKIFFVFLLLFSMSTFAAENTAYCAKCPPTTSKNFCKQFEAIAKCHCMNDLGGLPEPLCRDMNVTYQRMIAAFGSQEAACRWQEKNATPERTSYSQCMKDWNCYRLGGSNSEGLCSGTGKKC